MSIPGTSMEDQSPVHDLDPNAPPADPPDDEGIIESVKVGDQQMAPIAEVIRYRKEARAAKRENEAMRSQLENARVIGERLQQAQPLLERLQQMTPQQREALSSGRMASPAGTPQAEDDVEARELAEDYGLISHDGSLDVARARKILSKNEERIRRGVESLVAPIRQNSAQQQASSLRQQAEAVTDNAGMPLATRESIREAYDMLPPELAAQPNVAMVALGTAMLIDRMRNRAPKAVQEYADPIYSEPAAGRRQGAGITAEDRALATKVGLTDKDLTSAVNALKQGGRGVRME
jgi:hypothetical protein